MKVVIFTKNDFIAGVSYGAGEICGWRDEVADRLIQRGYAKLYGDGKPREVGGRIPNAKDWLDNQGLSDHVAALRKDGKWTPAPPVVVIDLEVQREARERARQEMN